MSIEDAKDIPADTEIRTDICVVGTGAAGLTIARLFNKTDVDVVVLEAGGLEREVSIEEAVFSTEDLGLPHLNPIPDRGRWFGGSTNLWFGRIAIPTPIDFETRSWVSNSGWPISFEELRPWFHLAADILEVDHFDKIEIRNWPANPTIETFIEQGGANLEVFLWANAGLLASRHHQILKTSDNVRVILNATAVELLQMEHSADIQSITAREPEGKRFRIKASTYVLAAGGLENPRLLLASTGRSRAGVGNAYDQVGRYYMEHPRGDRLAEVGLQNLTAEQISKLVLLDEKAPTPFGKAQLRVTFPPAMQLQEGLLNHSLHGYLVSPYHDASSYQSVRRVWHRLSGSALPSTTSVRADVALAIRSLPNLATLASKWLTNRGAPSRLVVVDQMEQEPDPLSRVTLNPQKRDHFGLPKLEVDWRIGDSTYRSQRRMHSFFKGMLERAGINSFTSKMLDEPECRPLLWDLKHPMGTTRMASGPQRGVVDENCRVHGIRNLYIAGSSVFSTGGHANPTLTIVALAARLASHLRHGYQPERVVDT
jgi:choline dehydrogenase-like flavoprotein